MTYVVNLVDIECHQVIIRKINIRRSGESPMVIGLVLHLFIKISKFRSTEKGMLKKDEIILKQQKGLILSPLLLNEKSLIGIAVTLSPENICPHSSSFT